MTSSHHTVQRIGRAKFVASLCGFAAVLAFFIAGFALKHRRHALELSGIPDVVAHNPVADAASPTGYHGGRRWLMLGDNTDPYNWVMQTQATAAGQGLRIRTVAYDNAPGERVVGWAMPHRLWLLGIGYVIHAIEHVPLGIGIERAVIWDGPIFHFVFGAALLWLVAWRYSLAAAGLICLGLIGPWPLRSYFEAINADHHGMIVAALMGMLIALHLGLRGRDGLPAAPAQPDASETPCDRRWMIVAGICGGIGLWLSAATSIPIVAAVLVGAGLSGLRRTNPVTAAQRAGAWRSWGYAGACTSLACYLVEHFPHHIALRLEVNSPVYALAWAGATELLALTLLHRSREAGSVSPFRSLRAAAAGLCVLQGPAVLLLTGHDSFWLTDDLVWGVSQVYTLEYQPFWKIPAFHEFALDVLWSVLPALCVVAVVWPTAAAAGAREWRDRLWVLWVPVVVLAGMALLQIRWLGVLCAAGLCLLIAWQEESRRARPPAARNGRRRTLALAYALVLPAAVSAAVALARPVPTLDRSNLLKLAERSLAYRLRDRIGSEPAILLAGPMTVNAMAYYGSHRGVGTLNWENREGLRRAAEIFAAPSFEEARRLIRTAGITHVVGVSWDGFEPQYVLLARGLPRGSPMPPDAFIAQLILERKIPDWLRPVPYRLPVHPAYEGEHVWIFEVVEPQPPDLQLVNEIVCSLESGDVEAARSLEPALRRLQNSVPALALLGTLVGKEQAAAEVLPRIEPLLAHEPALRLEDRIRVTMVLAEAGRSEAARSQLQQGYTLLSDAAIRRLTPGTLAALVRLADHLGAPMPARWRELADSLIPPYLR